VGALGAIRRAAFDAEKIAGMIVGSKYQVIWWLFFHVT
jgi:hypothetical protein